MNIFDHLDILIPIITLAFAFGGAAFVFKNNIKVLEELRAVIEEKIKSRLDRMEAYYIKDMKQVMTKDMCNEETNHCTNARDKTRETLEKKIDEIQAAINLQDLKRHEANNKTHGCWLEIHEKLATIIATQESNKGLFTMHDSILRERGGHESRIEEIEKILKYRAGNAAISTPFGRRASDKKENCDEI
jgi:ABC-type uncharacterized transport system ATPase subunit